MIPFHMIIDAFGGVSFALFAICATWAIAHILNDVVRLPEARFRIRTGDEVGQ